MSSTTVRDVKTLLAKPAGLESRLLSWHQERNKDVVGWAWPYEHTTWDMEHISEVLSTSEHPLGELTRQTEKPVIPDAYTDWPLSFLFHRYAQAHSGLPTSQAFVSYLKDDRETWVEPMRKIAVDQHKMSAEDAWKAMRWRIGLAWQSAMRECHMVSSFNEMGIPVRYHPLADVLFRVDGWCGRDLFALYYPNGKYPRKEKPEDTFPSQYRVHNVAVENQGRGIVWLASTEALERAIDEVFA